MNGARPNFVVDGSNIATEGRNLPSLAQLDDAVTALLAEYTIESLTVVVDATFAHRIDASERQQYEDALEAGELIAPPAGTVGRGDAFILQVAERAEATVFSNDSFQEFHGDYPWLFDPDRLLGGKPVSGIGWIFIKRIPVRGPKSRQSASQSRRSKPRRSKPKATSRPGPARDIIDDITSGKKTTAPNTNKRPKGKRPSGRKKKNRKDSTPAEQKKSLPKSSKKKTRPNKSQSATTNVEKSNDARSFLEFVTAFSIGDTATCVVERFASHGCYVKTGSAICYLPSRSMGDPPPAKARDVVSVGQELRVKIESYDPSRRGINVALESVGRRPDTSQSKVPNRQENVSQSKKSKTRAQQRHVLTDGPSREPNLTRSNIVATKKTAKKKAKKATKKVAKKASGKTVAKATSSKRAKKAIAKKAPAKKATKKVAKKAPAKKAAKKATKKVAKKAPAKKAAKKATKKKK